MLPPGAGQRQELARAEDEIRTHQARIARFERDRAEGREPDAATYDWAFQELQAAERRHEQLKRAEIKIEQLEAMLKLLEAALAGEKPAEDSVPSK